MRDSSPIILQAEYDGGYNGVRIDLRENKTYKITDGSALGGTCYRGNYTLNGTVIELDKPVIEKVIQTNYLVIKPVQHLDSSYHDYIFLFNPDDNTILNDHLSFKILKDNRKQIK